MKLSLLLRVILVRHLDIGLGITQLGVVLIKHLVALVKEVALGVVQRRICQLVEFSVPARTTLSVNLIP